MGPLTISNEDNEQQKTEACFSLKATRADILMYVTNLSV